MSIIERSNPLNLQYRICIVTGASSSLGTIICKTLLKANAFVFGVDTKLKDDSLNAGVGMHFQFEKCDLADSGSAERTIEAVRERFRLERLDILVNVVEEARKHDWKGVTDLSNAVGQVMAREGHGCVINVLESGDDAEGINLSKQIAKEYSGVRCNVVVSAKGERSNGWNCVTSRQHWLTKYFQMTRIMETSNLSRDMLKLSRT